MVGQLGNAAADDYKPRKMHLELIVTEHQNNSSVSTDVYLSRLFDNRETCDEL